MSTKNSSRFTPVIIAISVVIGIKNAEGNTQEKEKIVKSLVLHNYYAPYSKILTISRSIRL